MGEEDTPMPWKETCAMDQRVPFIGDWLSGPYSKTDLCRYDGISRPTGDKWIERYQRWGVEGLKERSRAARTHPNAVWRADFKGDFVLGNGRRCYPLTITDHFSGYLLQCRGLHIRASLV
jgi:transposase InsO family protein